MSANAQAEELWSILLPSGEIRKGTLDQLDEAFNAGQIQSTTPVLAPGATTWSTLGALAGLEDAPAPQQQPATPYSSPASLRPVAADVFVEFDDRTMLSPKKSRSGLVLGLLVALIPISVGIYVATQASGVTADDASKAAAAAVAQPPPKPAAPTATTPPPKPEASADDGKPKLTDDQKKALADADKKLADKFKSKKKDRESASAPARRAGPSYDPAAVKSKGGKCGCNRGDPMCSCY
jgi:hypothetical protein